MSLLDGKVAFITGAASGIGLIVNLTDEAKWKRPGSYGSDRIR
jgi:hypothetical protein